MVSEPNYVTSISIHTSIFAIAGYYTDYDGLQHVIVAEKDGNVYEVHWDASELAPGYHPPAQRLGYFGNSLVTIAGFFTLDDNYHHAVAGTDDGKLHQLYYKLNETPNRNDLDYPPISSFDPSKGMASFYSLGDNLSHVVIVDRMGNPVDITWNAHHPPNGKGITIPPTDSQVASISGFLATDDTSRHIIVARNDTGQIYDIAYPDEQHIPQSILGQDNVYVKTTFNEPVKNVTAFFSSDTNHRHIVVLTKENRLKDHAYDRYGGNFRSTLLTSSTSSPLPNNVADITSFYNAHDQLRHVLYATQDGSLYEITYTSQG
jgi:hypothetical protein